MRADCHMSRDGTYTPGAGSGSGYHQGAWANCVAVITGVYVITRGYSDRHCPRLRTLLTDCPSPIPFFQSSTMLLHPTAPLSLGRL